MSDTQQGWRDTSGGGGGGGTSIITIQNTLYVMKNGDDATALPNRLDKPFLTIYEASLQAVLGDVIYVFAGDYDEGTNDVFADGINYVLEDGVTVQCENSVITDNGSPKSINIVGNAILGNYVGDTPLINITGATTLNLTCKEISSRKEAILCSGEFNINVEKINSNIATDGNHCIKFNDGKATATYGIINVNSIVCSPLTSSSIFIESCNTDGTQRNIYINVQEIISNIQVTDYCFNIQSNNETRVYLQVENCQESSDSILIRVQESYLFVNNSNLFSITNINGVGILVDNDAILLITNSNIVSNSVVLFVSSNSCVQINNCILKSLEATRAIDIRGTSEISIYDSTIVSGTNATNTIIIQSTSFLRVKNCTIIANDPSTTYSIEGNTNPTNLYIYGQCSSNKPTSSFIINQVAGTNIVVDSDIVENSENFI